MKIKKINRLKSETHRDFPFYEMLDELEEIRLMSSRSHRPRSYVTGNQKFSILKKQKEGDSLVRKRLNY